MGGEAKPLGQPERRSSRSPSCDSCTLRVREHPARSQRQDREMGDTQAGRSGRPRDPPLHPVPVGFGQASRFRRFAVICGLLERGAHRDREGLIKIVAIARDMNPSGRRRYRSKDVLAHLLQGEGIVCAPGNRGSTRSSDLHEWRNDLGAVSTRDPVKLQSR
jgi:hypothetical protein